MTNHYKIQMLVFEEIDKLLASTLNSGKEVKINSIVLDLTKKYPVSQKSIEKRIELWVDNSSDFIEIKNGVVRLIK